MSRMTRTLRIAAQPFHFEFELGSSALVIIERFENCLRIKRVGI